MQTMPISTARKNLFALVAEGEPVRITSRKGVAYLVGEEQAQALSKSLMAAAQLLKTRRMARP